MEIDRALQVTNPLGRTQFVTAFATCFITVVSSWVNLSNVFIAEISEFHCSRSPGLTLAESVPLGEDGVSYAGCEQYINLNLSTDVQDCTNGWEYDTEVFGESVTAEFNLVCDRGSLPDVAQSIVIAGLGAGNIIWGLLADRWGRRPTFITALVLFNIVGVAISFTNSFIMFASLRFLWAFLHVGSWLPATVLLFEYLTPKHRSSIGNLPGIFFTLGLILLAGLAYLVKDWRWFSISLVVPTIIALPFTWFFPESVRWLLSAGKVEEAEKVMQHVGKFNKATNIPDSFFQTKVEVDETNGANKERIKTQKLGIVNLFKPPTLVITLVLTIQWFAFFLVYFGFALSTGELAGNPYVSFFISALVEIPARLIPIWLLKITGSVLPASLCFIFSGITMVAMVILDSGTISFTVCALFGKFCLTFNFAPIILLTSDVYPTTIRNIGTGMVQLGGRVGSIFSPILLYLDKDYPGLAFGSMAFVSFFAAVSIFFLPETLNTVQPATIEDLRFLINTRRLISKKGFRKPGKADTKNEGDSADILPSIELQKKDENATYQSKSVQTDDIMEGGVDNAGFYDVSL